MLREFELREAHDRLIETLNLNREEEVVPVAAVDSGGSTAGLVSGAIGLRAALRLKEAALCPELERLTKLFNSTKGDNWRNKKRWDAGP